MDTVAAPPILFNGKITLRNRETGEHRTFRIRTQKEDAKFAPGKRIIALLSGPDNCNDYQGFGFVDDSGITVWTKKRGDGERSKFQWFAIMLWGTATEQGGWDAKYEIMVEKKCLRCNRTLTEPESIIQGIGPICRGK